MRFDDTKLSTSEEATLGRMVEFDLRDRDVITADDVQRTLEGGARQSGGLYKRAAFGSDAQFRRIVRQAKATRQERLDSARALATPDAMTRCNTCELNDADPASPAGQCKTCETWARSGPVAL